VTAKTGIVVPSDAEGQQPVLQPSLRRPRTTPLLAADVS
jgi:hypothetical protein